MRPVLALLLLLCANVLPPAAIAQDRAPLAQGTSAYERAIEAAKSSMMADPEEGLAQSQRALDLAEKQTGADKEINRATALWLKSESLIGLNRLDEASDIATEALAIIQEAAPDTKLNADLLRSRGAVRHLSGNVQDALTDYQAAHEIFRKIGNVRSQAIALQDLGQIYWEAGDYERTLSYYEQATDIYNGDPGFVLGNSNNLGETYKMLGRFAEAEREYAKAIEAARELGSPLLETRILSNLTLVQIKQGKLAEAEQSANRARSLARSGEAADWRSFVYGVRAHLAYERGQLNEAASLLDQTFDGADLTKTDLIYREYHELAAKVFDQIGQPQKALAHLRAFQRLDSQARDLVASASSQLLAAEFDFANQNLRISQLKQGQLERDIQIERERSEFRTMAFVGIAFALTIVLGLTLTSLISIRRSRNETRAANAELKLVNKDLEHALKAKTDFLAMTSHEIRTPLNGILGTAQVLAANRTINDADMKRINLIKSAGETMKALVDDLLDVAKMESGDVRVELAPTALEPILKDAGYLWGDRLRAKSLDFISDIGELPALIESDGSRVRQIVFNLLSNAVKFTREGSVTLHARTDLDASEVIIEVRDTGIGIAASEQKQIFEAFHQVDNATTREFEGTGLGLAICKNLAAALGGRIELDSEVDVGSTFRLVLPAAEVQAADANSDERPLELSASRICLIEANKMKQAILAGLIEPHVKSVVSFDDADQGASAIETNAIDHIILDAASIAETEDQLPQLRDLLARARSAGVETTVLFSPASDLPIEAVTQMNHSQLLLKPIAGDAMIAALHDVYRRDPAAEGRNDIASAA